MYVQSNHSKILEVQLLSNLPQTSCAYAPIVPHMRKKFEVNRTKIKGDCQSDTNSAPQESYNDLASEFQNQRFLYKKALDPT